MQDFIELDLKKINLSENHRADLGDLAALMNSIKTKGLLHPVIVTKDFVDPNKYLLVAGYRRYNAVKKLNKQKITCHVIDIDSYGEQLIINLSENIQAKNTSLLEQGLVMNILIEKEGFTAKEVAVRVGVTQSYVKSCLNVVNNIPDKFKSRICLSTDRKYFKDGTIPSSVAVKLTNAANSYALNKKEEEILFEAWTKGVGTNATIKSVSQLIKKGKSIAAIRDALGKYTTLRIDLAVLQSECDHLIKKYKVSKQELIRKIMSGAIEERFSEQ